MLKNSYFFAAALVASGALGSACKSSEPQKSSAASETQLAGPADVPVAAGCANVGEPVDLTAAVCQVLAAPVTAENTRFGGFTAIGNLGSSRDFGYGLRVIKSAKLDNNPDGPPAYVITFWDYTDSGFVFRGQANEAARRDDSLRIHLTGGQQFAGATFTTAANAAKAVTSLESNGRRLGAPPQDCAAACHRQVDNYMAFSNPVPLDAIARDIANSVVPESASDAEFEAKKTEVTRQLDIQAFALGWSVPAGDL